MSSLFDSAAAASELLMHFDPTLWSIVGRSLWVSTLSTALACGLGIVLGAWLGVARFVGRDAVLTVLNTLLALPSVVVGLVVYLLLSRSGPLGFLGWLFSVKAMVLAQAILVLPVCMALTRQQIEDAERQHGEQLQSLGAGVLVRSLLLAWDARFALLTVCIAVFGRAISEVGAVMMVGGNIDGFTRVMTTTIALATLAGVSTLALTGCSAPDPNRKYKTDLNSLSADLSPELANTQQTPDEARSCVSAISQPPTRPTVFAKTETIKGQLVDEECFRKEKKVEADSSCAVACAKDGKPVAVLTADGKLYQVRGPLAENKNAKLVPHINHTVQITGEVTDFAGALSIGAGLGHGQDVV